MTLKIDNITVKNFLSIGNVTQAVSLNSKNLTLVLGENLDLGGDDTGSKNGTGKTTLINALSYAFYGAAINSIKKDNLINKTNAKNMLVTVEFSVLGTAYRIERGRRPNVLKFYVAGKEQDAEDDNSQGDSRQTQLAVESLLGMSHDMFKHIVALNTYTEPFLSMKANDQRQIIEQLLGITLLSEKADKLKEQAKEFRDMITEEEYRIKSVIDANKKIQEHIDNLKRRQTLWFNKHNEEINGLEVAIKQLGDIDIERELANHKLLDEFNTARDIQRQTDKDIANLNSQVTRANQSLHKIKSSLDSALKNICHGCGQDISHLENHKALVASLQVEFDKENDLLTALNNSIKELQDNRIELPVCPKTFYDNVTDAYNHKTSLNNLTTQLETLLGQVDPYTEQIEEMSAKGIEEVSYEKINQYNKIREHQEFLLKLLTNKDSFIRKRIIDQNLSYLNARLSYYLSKIGLPHTVEFKNDLTVEITLLGQDLDFDNLSRGERNRLILSLSWSFRDVWESLYHPINLLFIDEVVDSGMDASGVESSLAILKKMTRERNKSVFLVSHKDELSNRVNNILKVIKENGYTTYATSIEVV